MTKLAATEVIDAVYQAWADNDADAFVVGYAQDATAILPRRWLRGREQIRQTMAAVFSGALRGSSAAYEVQEVREIGDAVTVVTSTSAIRPHGADEPDPQTHARNTWILRRAGQGWLVESFQSTPDTP